MNHSAQCREWLTTAISSTPEGRARLDKFTEKENRHLAEHLRQHAEGDPALAQGGISSGSGQDAPESVPPTFELLPFEPAEEMPTPSPDETAPTEMAEPATSAPRSLPLGVSTPDPGAASGEVDLDLVLRMSRQARRMCCHGCLQT